jgi:hypothetical protein
VSEYRHRQLHSEYVEGCFACKLRTLEFGIVPGAAQMAAGRYIDTEALEDTFPREGAEQILEETDGVGTLKPDWKLRGRTQHTDAEGNPTSATYDQDLRGLYKRDRKTGDWEQASSKDVDKVLFGKEGLKPA